MFNSIENKQMIWNILIEQTKMADTPQFKQYFDMLVQQIDAKKHNYNEVVDMNKELLGLSHKAIQQMKSAPTRSLTVTREEETSLFQKQLQQKQDEFKKAQEGNKPKEIDFSDPKKTDYGNINRLMSQSETQRIKDLEHIQNTYTKDDALKWIGNGIKTSTGAPKLIIHDQPPKKVSFDLNQKKSNICVKLSYTENGLNKSMICHLSNGFRVFMSPHGKVEEKANNILENVEIFTN